MEALFKELNTLSLDGVNKLRLNELIAHFHAANGEAAPPVGSHRHHNTLPRLLCKQHNPKTSLLDMFQKEWTSGLVKENESVVE